MKFILTLFLIIFSISVFANIKTLSNEKISIDLNVNKNNVSLFQIKNNKGTEFINDVNNDPIWTVKVKENLKFNGDEIDLTPNDAANLIIDESNSKFILTWKNVKKDFMSSGFDVKVNVNIKEENSYWNIEVSANPTYGIWKVVFPYIKGLDATKGNRLSCPFLGGKFVDDCDSYGFQYNYPSIDCPYQLFTLTKNNSTLYISPEDLKGNHKGLPIRTYGPYKLEFSCVAHVPNMAVANTPYKQAWNFNLAIIDGDWYDGAKKYRKWGIENKFIPFEKGSIETRKDLPQWYKDLTCWVMMEGAYDRIDNSCKWISEADKILNVPIGAHLYDHSVHGFDSFYPNWLPMKDGLAEKISKISSPNIHIMPYSNYHIVDINQSPYYKEMGEKVLAKDTSLVPYETSYKEFGSHNVVACPDTVYSEYYLKEMKDLVDVCNFPALYIDQVSCEPCYDCFDTNHSHPVGGGDFYVQAYYKYLNQLRKNLSEKAPIVLTTEGSCETYPFDGWLRCNENEYDLLESPISEVIFSGYVSQFGAYYYTDEFEKENSQGAINKTAASLVRGLQPGWNILSKRNELVDYPYFGKYFKSMAEARYKAIKYFNLGEMVRNVNITSKIPYKKLNYQIFSKVDETEFPLIRTCSYNYKGKTMVCFTSADIENTNIVEWNSDFKSLNLKEKTKYKISEIYPNENSFESKKIGGKFELQPLETRIFNIE